MPDEPNTTMLDDSDDVNSTSSGDEEVVMDDIEAEAGILEDRDPEDYPSVLRITSNSEQTYREDAFDRLERWKAGEEVPHVINFQNPSDLRALLTDRHVERLRSIMAERPDSIRQLAERLDCDTYDTIEVSLDISTLHPADDAALG
ncbi:hypothetical protein SAMN06266787_1093 [Halorubrum ezzemoulense]|uniref:Uncharacterized protein n=1 Tax=Halorubrum ezzemoulense TaxID=337243 RepID=A0A238Y535_HALEZ|nr:MULTISPECIES: transcriptional regulator [Halorubrum]TKX64355.1 transcriptional regulator [Halorubrum sp. GN12_10-3_MGM]SNR66386.1 hypothetical protein SAMN06266787_1093 [Halorubrum ezzemoulense]